MENKRSSLLFIVALMLIILAACTRSAAPNVRPTAATTGDEGAVITAPATGDVMGQLELFVTQTAMAALGQNATLPPAAVTPAPGDATAAPAVPGDATAIPPAAGDATAIPATEAPAAPAVVVPTATPGLPNTYVLRNGEFPYCIARRFNVNPTELLNASGLGLNSKPSVGYQLRIPQTGNPFPGSRSLRSHPATHTVQAGESIYSIACLYGDVSPEAIAFANGLSDPFTVTSGQRLQIP